MAMIPAARAAAMAEAVRRAEAEAEESRKAVARFLARASHDLRQPFQAMHLFLHLLTGRLTDPAQRDLAERVLEAAQATETGLRGMVDHAALAGGIVVPAPESLCLGGLLERIAGEFQAEASAKGVRLRVRAKSLGVRVDPVLIERVLRHLIANAVRFTVEGGVLVGLRHRCGGPVIEVWDTGPGIPAADIASVFEPFYRTGQPELRRFQGLGLGLAVAVGTAALIDATLALKSREGRGTVVRLRLAADIVEAAAEDADASDAGQTVALVIEDEPVQRLALRMVLEDWAITVLEAADVEEALAAVAAADRPPGLVIADLNLGEGGSGLEALARVRDAIGRRIPAVIMSGAIDAGLARKAAAAGARVLEKPFVSDQLWRLITTIESE